MSKDLREQAYWLLLAFKSKLPTRIIHEIILIWCQQLGRTLQEFFAANIQEWEATCHLNARMIEKLEQAKGQIGEQMLLVEQLAHNHFHVLTVLDANYPKFLKVVLKRNQVPPVLCYAGNLGVLDRISIAIIGSRQAGETGLAFTREAAHYLAEHGANVISGNARGVDRTAYEAATSRGGYTTVVLPHGIRKLSGVQMREVLPKIEAGNVLLMSQFHPDASWKVSRAMERNKVVTGLAQVVIVAESDTKGGTWNGAISALKQKRPVYVCQTATNPLLAGNNALIELGARPLYWHTEEYSSIHDVLYPLLQQSEMIRHQQRYMLPLSYQLSLLLREQKVYYDRLLAQMKTR